MQEMVIKVLFSKINFICLADIQDWYKRLIFFLSQTDAAEKVPKFDFDPMVHTAIQVTRNFAPLDEAFLIFLCVDSLWPIAHI